MATIVAKRVLLATALVAALAGCGRGVTSKYGDAPNLESWVAEVKARPAPPLDPLPVMQQFETFEYAAQALRDPFSEAFTDISGGSGPRPDPNRPKQTLEQFPLDSMDMVGTYHQFGAFVSGVASLPRVVIMTMHNIVLTPRNATPGAKIGPNSILQLAGTVKTYRYLDDSETAEASGSSAPKKRGK